MGTPILSKNVLSMKFMQRTKRKVEEKEEEEKSAHLLSRESKSDDLDPQQNPESKVYPVEESFVNCEGLVFGRMSFKGMNPEIERLMEEKRKPEAKELEETEVSKYEMSQRYQNLDPQNQQGIKRKRNRYIRPVDDS